MRTGTVALVATILLASSPVLAEGGNSSDDHEASRGVGATAGGAAGAVIGGAIGGRFGPHGRTAGAYLGGRAGAAVGSYDGSDRCQCGGGGYGNQQGTAPEQGATPGGGMTGSDRGY